VYTAVVRFFDALERVITAVTDGVSGAWRGFRDGPLEHFLFALILVITGVVVLVQAAFEELDRLLAVVEKGLISVALLAMVALSFLDYLRREVPGFDLEIQGGPNMAVVLMVWVGFLGASLATRQRKHLAVDATDRILSPKAARLVKRFTALAAAVFCWHFTDFAMALVEESLLSGAGQDGLPLWDWLAGPVNFVAALVLSGGSALALAGLAVPLGFAAIWRRRWHAEALERTRPDEELTLPSIAQAVDAFSAVAGLAFMLLLVATLWKPTNEAGEPISWEPISLDATAGQSAADLKKLDAELDALIFDTGTPAPAKSGADTSVEALLKTSSAGAKFPMWLAQAVIPLSFALMALRFLGIALVGRFDIAPVTGPPVMVQGKSRGARDLIFAGLFPGIILGLGATLGMSTGTLILVGALLLLLTGAPLFLGVGVAAVACVTLIQDISAFTVAKDMYEAVKKEELLAIPFFVLAGNIMTKGTIADRLVGVARAAMGRLPGGLGLATIFSCALFAAISGSSPVTVIAVGSIMFPMLIRERYPERYSLGVLTSAGSLGIIIPPSVPMIIYAIMVGQTLMSVGKGMIDPETGLLPGGLETSVLQLSPNDLFIAGILPGLFIAGVLAVYTLYQTRPTRKDIDLAPVVFEGGYFANLLREVKRSWASLLLPVLILGGIYGVLGPLRFTVTEAAAVAVVYALLVELLFHRELKPKQLPKVLSESGVMMGSLFLIIVLAIAFNKFLAEQYIPQDAAAWLKANVHAKWQFLILANLFLLALGCVMDIISAILIVAPLLAPIALQYGIHPVHFGIMFIVNLELGYLTPPMGINLFVSSTVFERSVIEVIRATIPFFLLMLFCLMVIALVPGLSLALL